MIGYESELDRLGPLAPAAIGLVDYAKALAKGGDFERKGAMWVSTPNNFVAFRVPKRSREVVFSVYGFVTWFKKCPVLGIQRSRSSYSEFRLTDARQLGAAAAYIATACHQSQFKRVRKPADDALEKIL